jgi:hypothetical protein
VIHSLTKGFLPSLTPKLTILSVLNITPESRTLKKIPTELHVWVEETSKSVKNICNWLQDLKILRETLEHNRYLNNSLVKLILDKVSEMMYCLLGISNLLISSYHSYFKLRGYWQNLL